MIIIILIGMSNIILKSAPVLTMKMVFGLEQH